MKTDWIQNVEPELGSEPVAARNAEVAGASCLQLALARPGSELGLCSSWEISLGAV